MAAQQQPLAEAEEVEAKPDVKPRRRLATSYLGTPGLLRMIGSGDEDHKGGARNGPNAGL